MRWRLCLRLALLVALSASTACTSYVSWKHYESSEYLDIQREMFGRIRIRLDGVPLIECTVCLNPRNFYSRPCIRLDESGLFHKEAPRSYAWLQNLECKTDLGGTVSRDFVFPYYLADVRGENLAHYLGDVQIDLSPDGGTIVAVQDDLTGFNDSWQKHGQEPFKLKTDKTLLKLQENAWVEEQKIKKW